ncbi:hypothetical protein MMC12_003589 [Toensbergia leucococca]|nr:hypothetical protein [Toensbergia leucococca]
MRPPPIPIDPALDQWNSTNVKLPQGIGLDHLLQLPSDIQERYPRPVAATNLTSFPQDVQTASTKPIELESNPLIRFWNDPGPWTSQRIAGDLIQPAMGMKYASAPDRTYRPCVSLGPYRESARSDVDSSVTERHLSDSGYGTRSRTTRSVLSADLVDHSQGCRSLVGEVSEMQLYPEESTQAYVPPNPQEFHYKSYGVASEVPQDSPRALSLVCTYPNCNTTSRNHSEHK